MPVSELEDVMRPCVKGAGMVGLAALYASSRVGGSAGRVLKGKHHGPFGEKKPRYPERHWLYGPSQALLAHRGVPVTRDLVGV